MPGIGRCTDLQVEQRDPRAVKLKRQLAAPQLICAAHVHGEQRQKLRRPFFVEDFTRGSCP